MKGVIYQEKEKNNEGRIKILDREVVKDFLEEKLEEIEIPHDVVFEDLMEAFCRYVEDDYYEWLKDNFRSFFDHWKPDWNWIRDRIGYYSKS